MAWSSQNSIWQLWTRLMLKSAAQKIFQNQEHQRHLRAGLYSLQRLRFKKHQQFKSPLRWTVMYLLKPSMKCLNWFKTHSGSGFHQYMPADVIRCHMMTYTATKYRIISRDNLEKANARKETSIRWYDGVHHKPTQIQKSWWGPSRQFHKSHCKSL